MEATRFDDSKKVHKDKIKRIREIFEAKQNETQKYGILICQFSLNSTNGQALNQEYSIIDAIGIDNLTNVKREKFSLSGWSQKVNLNPNGNYYRGYA